MNNNNYKKIQILGNTQVSGYFAFCRLVNYDNMSQNKTIKNLYSGGQVVMYDKTSFNHINVVHHDDLLRSTNIGFVFAGKSSVKGVQQGSSNRYTFDLKANQICGIPYGDIDPIFVGNNFISYSSSNKLYAQYVLFGSKGSLYANTPTLDVYSIYSELSKPRYNVAYVDFCISTNVPLVMEYLGEIEVMQSDNNNKVNNSYFIINRYVENPL